MTLTAAPSHAGRGTMIRAQRTARYIAGEVVVLITSLVVASMAIFGFLAVLPGDQAAILGGVEATPEQIEALRQQMGLNRPLWEQYLDWFGGVLTGDLGTSALDGRSVAAELGEKLQVTVPLGLLALLLSIVIAVPVGVLAAIHRDSAFGRVITALSQLSAAIPTFVLGLALVLLVALPTRLFPVQGFPADRWADPLEALRSLILPATAIAIGQSAVLVRFVRSVTIDILLKDWVRTGLAQGWPLRTVLVRHGARNAALPLLGIIGLEIAGILMGSVIVEQIFALPGVGGMLLSDVGNRDITSIQSTLFVLTALVMITTVVLTTLSRVLDPRVRSAS